MTYSGIANNQSGLLWMLPYGATDFAYGTRKQYITYINPISETSIDIDVTGSTSSDKTCMGTVSGADHGVYGAPYFNGNDTYVAWYDGLETSKYGGVPSVPSGYQARWWGGCMAANGKIYSLPDM
jgi:hypothetical protein